MWKGVLVNKFLWRFLTAMPAIVLMAACQPRTPTAIPSPSEPTQAESPPVAIPIPGVTAAELVVRTGPGLQYSATGYQLAMEEGAPVIGETADGQWLQVEVRGQAGWLPASQVEVMGSLSSLPIVSTTQAAP